MSAAGIDHTAYRVEELENLIDPRASGVRNGVLRGHNADTILMRTLNLTDSKAIISFRDPRDAVASFLQRFGDYGAKRLTTCNDVSRNLSSLLTASQTLDCLSFFYEDGFTADPGSVRRIADFIGADLDEAQIQTIFAKYHADAVKSFITKIDKLPEDRLFVDQASNAMDRETSFHRTHISDMRIGKWRDVLDATTQELVSPLFDDYAVLLQDRKVGQGREPGRNPDVLPLGPVRVTFTSVAFAPVDSLEHFTRLLRIDEVASGLGVKVLDNIFLPIGRWSYRLNVPGKNAVQARYCQYGEVIRECDLQDGVVEFQHRNVMHDNAFDLHISYEGMEKDIAENAPVPTVTLQAELVPS
jgi:hypothetical protein